MFIPGHLLQSSIKKIETRLYTGFIIAILLVLVVGVMSYRTFRDQNHQAEVIKNTYEAQHRLQAVQQLLVDIESGRRGYRSTGQKVFLQPYFAALPKLKPALDSLGHVVRNVSEQYSTYAMLHAKIGILTRFWDSLGLD